MYLSCCPSTNSAKNKRFVEPTILQDETGGQGVVIQLNCAINDDSFDK
jgi:hypothetical protein